MSNATEWKPENFQQENFETSTTRIMKEMAEEMMTYGKKSSIEEFSHELTLELLTSMGLCEKFDCTQICQVIQYTKERMLRGL